MAALELFETPLFSDANLLSYWRMEGNSNDSKASADGTDTSITYSAGNGKFGQGAGFNGSTSKITVPDSNDLDLTGSHSISCWFNTNVNNANKSMVEKYSGGNGYALRLNSNGKLVFYNQENGGANTDFVLGDITVTTGVWTHAVATYDGTNLRIYLNGASDATPVAHTGGNTASAATLKFGVRGDTGDVQFWDGELDDIAIFDRALTADEVLSLYTGVFATGGNLLAQMI